MANTAPLSLNVIRTTEAPLIMKTIIALLLFCFTAVVSAQWSYRTTNDSMRGTKTRFAELNSTNRAQLSFPYGGGSKLQLIIRKKSDADTDVVFLLDRGQVPCHTDCRMAAKFDDDEVAEWELSGPASGRSASLFVDEANDFLERLKTAKKLVVEVQIYDHGSFQFTFNPKGLKWEWGGKKQETEDEVKQKLAEAAADKKRQENIQRITSLAGADAKGVAQKSSGPSASYGGKVRAKVQPNIVFTEDIAGNPTAEVEVRTALDGSIIGQRLIKPSGHKAWDEAVIKAIIRTETVPRDVDGRVPSSMILEFRPRD